MLLTPHGFCLLTHERAEESTRLYRLLLACGFGPWDRNGLPLFCVLSSNGTKQEWFEAGYLAGAKVPLFLVGTGQTFRKRHVETISRLGGWAASAEGSELADAIVRRGIVPTAWDEEARVVALARVQAKNQEAEVEQ